MDDPANDGSEALVRAVAAVILDGFDRHYRLFREISAGARARFERADWAAVDEANRERIDFYDRRVHETVRRLRDEHPGLGASNAPWPAIRLAYVALLHQRQHRQPECAETYFNSVACQVLDRRYYDNAHIFWRPAVATDYLDGDAPTLRSHYPSRTGLRRALLDILCAPRLALPWRSLRADLRTLERRLRAALTGLIGEPFDERGARPNHQLQVLTPLFYRNKGTYIVARAIDGDRRLPFVISLVRTDAGALAIDALLSEEQDIAMLFSFSRAYFMVDTEVPAACAAFLHELMPYNPKSELYSLLGLQKHAKTAFYRDLHHHLQFSSDNFRIADGIRGMVMLVFTLPSFPFVFKVIRDRFDPPKSASREEVRQKYRLVKNHDRVGRLADTLEFSNVALPLERIEPGLLAALERDTAMNIEREGDKLIVRHVYIERRMTPLNTYLASVHGVERERVIRDYGQAIRDLAGADIFPGDMMLKNFGVTRHGRVVFYDYDEICYLSECRFRRVPPMRDGIDDLSAEPWYSVRSEDVFPETFQAYFFADASDKRLFHEHHAELVDADFWREQQTLIGGARRADVFPYPERARLGSDG